MMVHIQKHFTLSSEKKIVLTSFIKNLFNKEIPFFILFGVFWTILINASLFLISLSLDIYNYIGLFQLTVVSFFIGGLISLLSLRLSIFIISLIILTCTLQVLNIQTVHTTIYGAQLEIFIKTFPQGFEMAADKGVELSSVILVLLAFLPLFSFSYLLLKYKNPKSSNISGDLTFYVLLALLFASFTHNGSNFSATPFNLVWNALFHDLNSRSYSKAIEVPFVPESESSYKKIVFGGNDINNMPSLKSKVNLYMFNNFVSLEDDSTSLLVKMMMLRKNKNQDEQYQLLWSMQNHLIT